MDELEAQLEQGQAMIDAEWARQKKAREAEEKDDKPRRRVARYARGGAVKASAKSAARAACCHKNGPSGCRPSRGAYSK